MRRAAAGLAALLLACLVVAAPVTLARLTSSQDASGAFTTGTIAPPTSLGASLGGTTVTLTWTPTVSTATTGYELLRSPTSGSGFSVVSTVTPRTAATTTNSPGNGTWFYVLASVYQSWRSASSNEAKVTLGSTSTGFKDCASTAADTGGDGDGYESSPANACAQDGAVAVDASSGTSASSSCADAGNDRHRFWGYGFGLPGSVSAVEGITVRLRAGLNNNGGTTAMCAQLSWDGGASWTASRSITPTNTLTTFTLGGAADTWGRSWTSAELSPSNFRLRVIDASSMANKDVSLDWAGVQVDYTP
jgi:hypothetical protein